MDFENFFYVILAVIYFLSRVLKGRKNVPKESQPDEEAPASSGKKPVTFEDLLKEFGVDQEEEPKEAEEPQAIEEEATTKEETRPTYSDDESKAIFEKSIKEAEKASRKSTAIGERKLTFKEFEPYQEEDDSNEFATEIKELLQESEGGKKAVVLSEILNRKY